MTAKSIEITFEDWEDPKFYAVCAVIETITGEMRHRFLTVLPKSVCYNEWMRSGLSDIVREIVESDITGKHIEVKYVDD